MRNSSTEDYLKAICHLQEEGGRAGTSLLARRLRLSGASVTDMLKRLAVEGLVEYAPYRGVVLTRAGRRVAMRTLRRHRLWEMFLVRHLGFSWDQIHDEAERLEHVTSTLLEQRLDEALGFPVADPHGDPIPSPDGTLRVSKQMSLAEAPECSTVVVRRVRDADRDVLRYVTALGIRLKTKMAVKEKVRFDQSVRVRIGSTDRYLSAKLARSIYVEPVKQPAAERRRRP
jgi:DtxR family Mn-dependent transcriptional regulator